LNGSRIVELSSVRQVGTAHAQVEGARTVAFSQISNLPTAFSASIQVNPVSHRASLMSTAPIEVASTERLSKAPPCTSCGGGTTVLGSSTV